MTGGTADTRRSSLCARPYINVHDEVGPSPGTADRDCLRRRQYDGGEHGGEQRWALLPVLVAGDPFWLGVVNATLGVGALGASWGVTRVGAHERHLTSGAVLSGAAVAAAAAASLGGHFWAVAAAGLVWGWARSWAGAAMIAVFAREIPATHRARAFGVSQVLNQGTNPVGAAAVAAFGAAAAWVCAGLFASVALVLPPRRFRHPSAHSPPHSSSHRAEPGPVPDREPDCELDPSRRPARS